MRVISGQYVGSVRVRPALRGRDNQSPNRSAVCSVVHCGLDQLNPFDMQYSTYPVWRSFVLHRYDHLPYRHRWVQRSDDEVMLQVTRACVKRAPTRCHYICIHRARRAFTCPLFDQPSAPSAQRVSDVALLRYPPADGECTNIRPDHRTHHTRSRHSHVHDLTYRRLVSWRL